MPASQRYKLTLAYRGTAYAGWQRQDNALAVHPNSKLAILARLPSVRGTGFQL